MLMWGCVSIRCPLPPLSPQARLSEHPVTTVTIVAIALTMLFKKKTKTKLQMRSEIRLFLHCFLYLVYLHLCKVVFKVLSK